MSTNTNDPQAVRTLPTKEEAAANLEKARLNSAPIAINEPSGKPDSKKTRTVVMVTARELAALKDGQADILLEQRAIRSLFERIETELAAHIVELESKLGAVRGLIPPVADPERCRHCFGEKTVTVSGITRTCPKCKGTGERKKAGRLGRLGYQLLNHPFSRGVIEGAAVFIGGAAASLAYRGVRGRLSAKA